MTVALVAAWTGLANSSGAASLSTGSIDTSGGNFVVATVTCNIALTSVTDSKSNSYTLLGPFNAGGGDNLYIAYTNASAAATCGTAHVVTANAAGSNFFSISAVAYSGLATSGVLDKSAHSNGTGTALDSTATASTTQANILLIGAGTISVVSNTTWAAGTNYTLRSSIGTGSVSATGFIEDRIVSAISTYNATATSSVSGGWDCAVAAFKDATAGGGGISGTASITLADVTLSAASTLKLTGVLATTLANLTLAAAGTLKITGVLAQTLADVILTATATGTVSTTGVLAVNLDNVVLAGTSALKIQGQLAVVLGTLILTASNSATVTVLVSRERRTLLLTPINARRY